jgi:DNA-binding HxlR family transcriptional regulator
VFKSLAKRWAQPPIELHKEEKEVLNALLHITDNPEYFRQLNKGSLSVMLYHLKNRGLVYNRIDQNNPNRYHFGLTEYGREIARCLSV